MKKQVVTEELKKMIEEMLENILCGAYHNVQSVTRTVIDKVVQQVMLEFHFNDIIGKTLYAQILTFHDIEIASKKISKKLLMLGSHRAPIETFLRRRTNAMIDTQSKKPDLTAKSEVSYHQLHEKTDLGDNIEQFN